MASDGPMLPYQPPSMASTAPVSTVPLVVPQIRRTLVFASTKPPFNSRGIVADQEIEAIVVRSPVSLKILF
ncbi:hypothetical protein ES288_A11G380700v1 [Gossypium darwinii]|uniref:Uncharacterized protein n=1 Tax=Gossypium darwinii TaxID=34276 RepID=A0A5D2ETY2_GOSDA|nr:hypothetical protein ES288_A11G380700v1 [Gossypium darwinii]